MGKSNRMAEHPPVGLVATPDGRAARKATTLEDLAAVVAGVNRFLAYFSGLGAFRDSNTGVAEWLVLEMISTTPNAGPKRLSDVLGIKSQRIVQILDSLTVAGLVRSSAQFDDFGNASTELTDTGRDRMDLLSTALRDQMLNNLQGHRVVNNVANSLHFLTKVAS
jgi:DNA-binding MarR family transcriptional regulator